MICPPYSQGLYIYVMVKTHTFVVYKWRDRRRDRVTSITKQRHQMSVKKKKHRNMRREKKKTALNYLRMSDFELHSLRILQRQTVELKCSFLVSVLLSYILFIVKVIKSNWIILDICSYWIDVCNTVNCGSGVCLITQNPSLPYFCRCPSGSNTILPCPSDSLFYSIIIFLEKIFW
jgi:hypothetical protein